MNSLIREPLVHFLIIGAAFFFFFELFDDPAGSNTGRIVVSQGQIEFLKANYSRTWQRPPSDEEMRALVDNYVLDEIFYREALALGLDKNDQIIRRRLKQKMTLLSNDLAQTIKPSEEELNSFLTNHPDLFRKDPQLSFSHIFFDPGKRGLGLEADAGQILDQLAAEEGAGDTALLGDTLMIPQTFKRATLSEILRYFGEPFGAAVMDIPVGSWTGLIRSGYGYHLVLVTEKTDARLPDLSEVRPQVEREWMATRQKQLHNALVDKLRKNYTVEIEQPTTVLPEDSAEATGEKG